MTMNTLTPDSLAHVHRHVDDMKFNRHHLKSWLLFAAGLLMEVILSILHRQLNLVSSRIQHNSISVANSA